MVDALHGDGGVGKRVAMYVTHKALNATVNLHTHTHTERKKAVLIYKREEISSAGWMLIPEGNI